MNRIQRATAYGHLVEALKRTPFARYYATGERELLGLSALLAEWQEERDKSFTYESAVELIESLRPFAPLVFQQRPDEPVEVEKVIDGFSGQAPENPWITNDLASQMAVAKQFPQLAEKLKKRAKHGGSLSYAQLIEEREADEAAKVLRDLPYGTKEHGQNPYLHGDLEAQMKFRREHGDAIADFYKREAQPATLPWIGGKDGGWINISESMKMGRQAPELRQLVDRSLARAKEWASEDMFESEKQLGDIQARRAVAQNLLGAK